MANLEVASYTHHEHHLSDRIFSTRQKSEIFLFSLVFWGQKVRYMIKPSSVTKRNIMDVLGNGLVMYYTPHQCWYSDRKSPYWEKSKKVP